MKFTLESGEIAVQELQDSEDIMQIYLYRNNQQEGPYTEQQIRDMVKSGAIKQNEFAWHEGLSEWHPLDKIIAFPRRGSEFEPSIKQLTNHKETSSGNQSDVNFPDTAKAVVENNTNVNPRLILGNLSLATPLFAFPLIYFGMTLGGSSQILIILGLFLLAVAIATGIMGIVRRERFRWRCVTGVMLNFVCTMALLPGFVFGLILFFFLLPIMSPLGSEETSVIRKSFPRQDERAPKPSKVIWWWAGCVALSLLFITFRMRMDGSFSLQTLGILFISYICFCLICSIWFDQSKQKLRRTAVLQVCGYILFGLGTNTFGSFIIAHTVILSWRTKGDFFLSFAEFCAVTLCMIVAAFFLVFEFKTKTSQIEAGRSK